MKNNIWSGVFNVASFQIDKNKRLTIDALVSHLQEAAVKHKMKAGLSYSDFKDKNTVWLKNRLSIKIDRVPVWEEDIRIETWIKEVKGIFLFRDFYLKDKNDNLIVKASGVDSLLVSGTKEPQKLDFINNYMKVYHDKIAKSSLAPKVDCVGRVDRQLIASTKYSDIDFNGYISNIKYIQWMLDVVPTQAKDSYTLKEFDINYLSELHIKNNICIDLEKVEEKETYLVSITNCESGKGICRAKFVF